EIAYAPVFIGDHCQTTVPTPHGSISAEWRRDGDKLHVGLTLPSEVKARIKLPGLREQTCRRNGQWTIIALKTP
ncbi:MAG: alpha-L-rhamnosidase C-terminal domain-containing protein, partial [Rariglobus sp.]